MYRQMGGQLITLGSDAHEKGDICEHFDIAIPALKDLGFTHYHYYKDRKPCAIDL